MTCSILLVPIQIGSNWVLAMDQSFVHSHHAGHFEPLCFPLMRSWGESLPGSSWPRQPPLDQDSGRGCDTYASTPRGAGGGRFKNSLLVRHFTKGSRHFRARIQAQMTLPLVSGKFASPKNCGFEWAISHRHEELVSIVSRVKVSGLNTIISPPRLLFENIAEARIVTSRTSKKAAIRQQHGSVFTDLCRFANLKLNQSQILETTGGAIFGSK